MSSPVILPDERADPERLSETELAYHRQVLGQIRQLEAVDQQIAQLQAQRVAILGARDSWMRFQQDARRLAPGDTIDGDGYVVRQVPNGAAPEDGGN